MLYRPFGRMGWNVSAVSMGTWNIGNQWGYLSDDQALDIVRAALDNGINLFDTADAYGIPHGMSELRLGKIIPSVRDKVFIVSKIGNWGLRSDDGLKFKSIDSVRLCGHAICGRMKIEYADVMLCHIANIEDPTVFIEGFQALVKEGFAREYGISTNNFDVFKRFYDISNGECAVLELDYSLINKQPEEQILDFCREHGVGVLVRGPLAMGVLAGKYDESTVFTDNVRAGWNDGQPGRAKYLDNLAKMRSVKGKLSEINPELPLTQAAVRYVISHPAQPVAIPGMTSPKQVADNAEAGKCVFTPQEFAQL
ncbi:MAG: aldo/keto reductase [Oscillospiraceae bacterium]|nr:aldo/keto reductase [Oscillospiraceae bacterium]